MNKRDAINEVLLALNELPLDVSDNVDDIPTALLVDRELDIARKKILSYGWKVNTLSISFYPNEENNIVISDTFLSADGGENNPNYVVRDWKLFDKDTNSFLFTSAVTLEVIDDIVFDDIPFSIANYIIQHASLKAYIDIIGTTEDIATRRAELMEAKTEALRYDARISSTNILKQDYATTNLSRSS